MSKKISVRKLKNHTSGVRPYAADAWPEPEEARQSGLTAMKRLAGEVGAAWTSPSTTAELVAEQRR